MSLEWSDFTTWGVIENALRHFSVWFMHIWDGALERFLGWAASIYTDHFPSGAQPTVEIERWRVYVRYLNTWAPLDFGFSLLSCWMATFTLVHGYRWAKSHISTASD